MTFSVVARDGDSWGVAVASRFLAAGAVVPAARAGLGAVATQSFVNLRYVPDGFALLAQGLSAQQALDRLVAADALRARLAAGARDNARHYAWPHLATRVADVYRQVRGGEPALSVPA